MDGKTHFERKMNMEYESNNGNLKLNIQDNEENFYSSLREIEIDPRIAVIGSCEIDRTGARVKFSSPLLCSTDGEIFDVKLLGVKFEGDKPDTLIDGMSQLKQHIFGDDWLKAVERQKKRMEERRKLIHEH